MSEADPPPNKLRKVGAELLGQRLEIGLEALADNRVELGYHLFQVGLGFFQVGVFGTASSA